MCCPPVLFCTILSFPQATNTGVEEPFKYLAAEFHRRYADTVNQADDMVGSEY